MRLPHRPHTGLSIFAFLFIGSCLVVRNAEAQVLLSDDFDSENGGKIVGAPPPAGTYNYTAFAHWDVTRGTVDLVDDTEFGWGGTTPVHGQGLYVDMDGSTRQAGRMESKTTFNLGPGSYILEFDLAGTHWPVSYNDKVTVSLGTVFSEVFATYTSAPFQTITRLITVTAPTTGKLIFDHNGGDNGGMLLDNVMLLATTASYAAFGSGCVGSNGVPTLAPGQDSLPRLGRSFSVELTNLPTTPGVVYVIFGCCNTSWQGVALPLDLSSFGLFGCNLLVSVEASVALPYTTPKATWSVEVPSDNTLLGLEFYNQAVSIDPSAPNLFGVALSNARHGVIGK